MGCSKNLIDSENIITHLNYNGFEASFQKGNKSTQTVVINTCGFIHDAKTESIDAILQFADLKTKGKIKNYTLQVVFHRDIKMISYRKYLRLMVFWD